MKFYEDTFCFAFGVQQCCTQTNVLLSKLYGPYYFSNRWKQTLMHPQNTKEFISLRWEPTDFWAKTEKVMNILDRQTTYRLKLWRNYVVATLQLLVPIGYWQKSKRPTVTPVFMFKLLLRPCDNNHEDFYQQTCPNITDRDALRWIQLKGYCFKIVSTL